MDASTESPVEWTVLAHLLRPQGRRGEILAELLTDFPERFADGQRVFLAPPEFAGRPEEARSIAVLGHWLPVGRNHGRIVLTLEGIDSISKAETLNGQDVVVPVAERMELDEDEEYISDLIGCAVFDAEAGDASIGIVTGVEFATTPDGARRLADAAPLLLVTSATGDEILIPYVQSFVVALSVPEKRIDLKLPAGLLDINRPNAVERDAAEEDADEQ